jgi:hypothetical protein
MSGDVNVATGGQTLSIGGDSLGTTANVLTIDAGAQVNFNSKIITGLAAPVNIYDGTNKTYVDTATQRTSQVVTQAGHGFTVGQLVYKTVSSWALADASAEATAEVYGVIESVVAGVSFVLVTNGFISMSSPPLSMTAGTTYFLSETSGAYTATPPTATGSIVKPVMQALSSSTAIVVAQMRGAENTGQTTQIAQTYWVSKGGSDTTGDGSLIAPYATVQKAHDAALAAYPISGSGTAYVQINIGPGSYSGNTTITRQRTIFNGFAGPQAAVAVNLNGAFTVNTSTSISKFIDQYTFQGIRFGQSGTAATPAFSVTGSGPCLVLAQNCYFESSSTNSAADAINLNTTSVSPKVRLLLVNCTVSCTGAANAVNAVAGAEFWTNNCTVQSSSASGGYALKVAADCTVLAGITEFNSAASVGCIYINTTGGTGFPPVTPPFPAGFLPVGTPVAPVFLTSCGVLCSSNTASGSGIIVVTPFCYLGTVNCTFSIANAISSTADCARSVEASPAVSGTSTAVGTTTLTDSTKTWTTNQWAGYYLRITTSTSQQFKLISSNTATQLTVSASFSPALTSPVAYQIVPAVAWQYSGLTFLADGTTGALNNSYTSGITVNAFTTTPTSGGSP